MTKGSGMIGLMGLGRMGRAMAERLEEEGVSLVVWNRTPAKADGLAAEVVARPADLAGKAGYHPVGNGRSGGDRGRLWRGGGVAVGGP